MNENIDLTNILKDCPKGWKFYTPVWGEVTFIEIKKNKDCLFPICICTTINSCTNLTKDGRYLINRTGTECILFPSKEQRDWSKFTAPWYKKYKLVKPKFDPKILQPFDKVLVRDKDYENWNCGFFSHKDASYVYNYRCIGTPYIYCIPYNDDTKHLVGTTDEAPEFYRYWED